MPLTSGYITNRGVTPRGGRRITPFAIVRDVFTDPATLDADGISVSHAGAAAASTRDQTIGGALASGGVANLGTYPRNVVITVTHGSAVIAMSGTIYGTDLDGKAQTEAWSVTAGGTTKTFTGKKAFATVNRITETVAADASTNTIISGTGNVLGLRSAVALAGVGAAIKEVAAGSIVTTGTLVATSTAATDDKRGTYLPATAPNGSNDYEVYYLSNPESE